MEIGEGERSRSLEFVRIDGVKRRDQRLAVALDIELEIKLKTATIPVG